MGQPELCADMAFGQTDGFGQFLNGGELTGLHAPQSSPCAADCAKDVRASGQILAWAAVGERQDLRPPVLLARHERDQQADRIVWLGHLQPPPAAARLFAGWKLECIGGEYRIQSPL